MQVNRNNGGGSGTSSTIASDQIGNGTTKPDSGHIQAPATPATAAAAGMPGPNNPSAVFRGPGPVPAAPSPAQAHSYAVEPLDRSASSSDSEALEPSHGVRPLPEQSGPFIPFPGPTVTVTKVGDARK
jgi:hypothetical protein